MGTVAFGRRMGGGWRTVRLAAAAVSLLLVPLLAAARPLAGIASAAVVATLAMIAESARSRG